MKYEEFLRLEKQRHQERGRYSHIESEIQKSCVAWFRSEYPNYICFAVPNGGARNRKEAGIMKGEGVLAGVSDLIIVADNAVLFVELKKEGGTQQKTQKEFQRNVERLGHTYAVCHSVAEFKITVERWLKEKYGVYDTSI